MDPGELDDCVRRALEGNRAAHAQVLHRAATAGADGVLDHIVDTVAGAAAAGDDTALELLLELVHRCELAQPSIRRLIVDDAHVDDIAQSTLMAVERNIARFEQRAKFRTWLFTVARNEALMSLRRRAGTPTDDLEPPPTGAARMSSVIATRETIGAAIADLPEPYRSTLDLQIREQLDYEQIAARQGVPVGTVRSRLAKARDLLAERLDLGDRGTP